MTRIVFHFPLRNRNQKHTLMPQMWAVANTQHQYTFPPSHTVSAVGMTISGHASANVSAVTYFVSPAPRSANANDRFTASTSEKNATNSRSVGTTAAMAANSSAFAGSRGANGEISSVGTAT